MKPAILDCNPVEYISVFKNRTKLENSISTNIATVKYSKNNPIFHMAFQPLWNSVILLFQNDYIVALLLLNSRVSRMSKCLCTMVRWQVVIVDFQVQVYQFFRFYNFLISLYIPKIFSLQRRSEVFTRICIATLFHVYKGRPF